MRYIKEYKDGTGVQFEVDRDTAKRTLESGYKPEAIEMLLESEGTYNCPVSWLSVVPDEEENDE